MDSDGQTVNISDELTGIYHKTREEVSEDTAGKMDEIWLGLKMFVAEVNKSLEGKSRLIDLHGQDPKEVIRLAEGHAFSKLNQLLWEVADQEERGE